MSSLSSSGPERLLAFNRGMGCAFLFALPFMGFGILALGMCFVQVSGWWEARDWGEHPATIRSVKLNENRDGDGGTTYTVDATYDYRVGAQNLTGNRVWLLNSSDNVGDFYERVHRELQDHLNQNRPFRCYVDPLDASKSILYRDLRWGLLAFTLIFVVMFGGVGFGILLGLWHVRRKARLTAERSDEFPDEPWK